MDRQRKDRLVASENRRRTVPLMHVGIHYHRSFDRTVSLHLPDGHCDVMNHAESFAMIGIRMMKAAANICAKAIFESAPCGQNRTARGEPARLNQLRGI